MLDLLQQYRAEQDCDGDVLWGDHHHGAAALDFLVDPIDQVCVPHLLPVLICEVPENEYVFSGFNYQRCRLGEHSASAVLRSS